MKSRMAVLALLLLASIFVGCVPEEKYLDFSVMDHAIVNDVNNRPKFIGKLVKMTAYTDCLAAVGGEPNFDPDGNPMYMMSAMCSNKPLKPGDSGYGIECRATFADFGFIRKVQDAVKDLFPTTTTITGKYTGKKILMFSIKVKNVRIDFRNRIITKYLDESCPGCVSTTR